MDAASYLRIWWGSGRALIFLSRRAFYGWYCSLNTGEKTADQKAPTTTTERRHRPVMDGGRTGASFQTGLVDENRPDTEGKDRSNGATAAPGGMDADVLLRASRVCGRRCGASQPFDRQHATGGEHEHVNAAEGGEAS